MSLTIKQRGLDETARFFTIEKYRTKNVVAVLPLETAKLYREDLVQNIQAQDFPGARIPLDTKYLSKKLRKGWDKRILIATGEYLKSIKVFKVKNKNSFFVGPSPYKKVPGMDLYYSQLGAILNKVREHIQSNFEKLKNNRDKQFRMVYNVYR